MKEICIKNNASQSFVNMLTATLKVWSKINFILICLYVSMVGSEPDRMVNIQNNLGKNYLDMFRRWSGVNGKKNRSTK